ncbi:carbohydrate ABC transporter membrane protein 2, CUT1 family [Leifsonia sp. 98AMF]|uniref:carbohydrate ABC transporter permease n=1 Tax=unclassified Leifsonia TaxID=2663824 RepID=UPI000879CB69|nr:MULTISPECIES: carbohydrate ABC transporter permease [unclassified Leifsonia]SDH61774.1 carbohydrate ABC transporter membrane protein 2, CUT1 family [Leifsonia sp. 197AMF]SDI77348.1 carbohydrate ABC transporter membrane protein 2, CUT1 family [Leifsonia sp. 466MF]SDK09516.1 carbohydrate ABC transporter membrane protein 2, CUT1 family [Leifsonia sp. 157MF]SDN80744.1 carbohydrate ABC transporter membrane protein 2, CUT1 family [Leifsonia sp. 509MF]SEB09635.1 carbohydrate ABC transporter membra
MTTLTETAPPQTSPQTQPAPRVRRKRRWSAALIYAVVIIWSLISLFPALFAVSSSFKLKRDVLQPLNFIFTPTLNNYTDLFVENHMGGYIQNSIVVTIGSVIPSLFLALMAAYGLTRFGLRKERSVALNILSFRMIPAIAVVIPFFLITQFIHLLDTPWILIIATLTMNVPLAVWMLRGFMRDIPVEIDEAAQLDGASRWRILWTVHFRLLGPGIVSTALLLVIQTWNEFAFAQFLTSVNARTYPTTVNFFISIAGTDFGQMAAAITVGTIPVLILAALFQRRLVSGLSYGAV